MAVAAGHLIFRRQCLNRSGSKVGALHPNLCEPSIYLQGMGLSHPDPSLNVALVGLVLALSGIAITYLYYWRRIGLHGLSERNRYARNGYTFLK